MSDPDNRSCVLEGDSIGPLHGSDGVVEGEGLQISDMSSWGNESAFSRNRETKEGVDYGRWKLSQEGSQGYMARGKECRGQECRCVSTLWEGDEFSRLSSCLF